MSSLEQAASPIDHGMLSYLAMKAIPHHFDQHPSPAHRYRLHAFNVTMNWCFTRAISDLVCHLHLQLWSWSFASRDHEYLVRSSSLKWAVNGCTLTYKNGQDHSC